jgi:hypothetical protein
VRLDVPLFIDWVHLAWKLRCCFCCVKKKHAGWKAYNDLIKSSNVSVSRDLDLIRFLRAKRLHGFGLNSVLSKDQLSNSAVLAYTRPIREQKEEELMFGKECSWYSIEGIDKYEKVTFALFKRGSIMVKSPGD